jgi:hypothetical protein
MKALHQTRVPTNGYYLGPRARAKFTEGWHYPQTPVSSTGRTRIWEASPDRKQSLQPPTWSKHGAPG